MAVAQAAPEHAPGGNTDGKAAEKRDGNAPFLRSLVRRVGEPAQQNHAGFRGVPGSGTVGNKSRRTDTKAHKCIELAATGMSTKQIAEIVGCHPAYVRVAVRQRRGSSRSEIDASYAASELGKETARKNYARYWRAGDAEEARMAGRSAYHATRMADGCVRDARLAYLAAYSRKKIVTGLAKLREARHDRP